jgi:hypothetical protein
MESGAAVRGIRSGIRIALIPERSRFPCRMPGFPSQLVARPGASGGPNSDPNSSRLRCGCETPPERWPRIRCWRYLTLPAVRPPTRRFSMSMNRMTTGRIATIETPNTYCQLVSY